jgi:flagellar biosynthesis/type III secretory pathway protein FliH
VCLAASITPESVPVAPAEPLSNILLVQVGKKLAPLEKAVRILGKKPKPKPKVEEANATAANATDAENATAAEGAAEAEGESQPTGEEGAAEGSAEGTKEGKKDEL